MESSGDGCSFPLAHRSLIGYSWFLEAFCFLPGSNRGFGVGDYSGAAPEMLPTVLFERQRQEIVPGTGVNSFFEHQRQAVTTFLCHG